MSSQLKLVGDVSECSDFYSCADLESVRWIGRSSEMFGNYSLASGLRNQSKSKKIR